VNTPSARDGAVTLLPGLCPAHDEGPEDTDEVLARDPEFAAVLDARRAGWLAALEAALAAQPTRAGAWAARIAEGHDDECT
jgi:hypothetical protein